MGTPFLVVQIPADRGAETFVKAMVPLPAELALELGAVDGIAAIVAEAIFDVGDEGFQRGGGVAAFLGDEGDEAAQEGDILPFVLAADVVGFADAAAVHDRPDRFVVILDIDPVADVLAVAVDGERLAFQHVEDHQGDELLGELEGAVVVGAVRDGDREAIGMEVGFGEVVAGGFGGRIGRAGIVGGGFGEIARVAQRAEDFVSADMMEEDVIASGPGFAGDIEEGVGAEDIGANEGFGAENRAVNVAFSGEVDDGVDGIVGEGFFDEGAVGDVALDEGVASIGARTAEARRDVGEALGVTGIGEGIEVDDAAGEVRPGEEPVDKVRADEA